MLTYGELFAGYGGLGMGVQSVLGGRMAWCSEFDPAPSAILAHHWPDAPNLGDITKVDWTQVEPVDVITGGSPCQDLSHAGRRAGMKAGTRSGLWASMCDAIDIIRPRLVVWENVRGALSADADSAMEPCPGCVGGGDDGPVLRALGRVLGDLAELGYDAWWTGIRAADVGAPHGRFRLFVFAVPADAPGDPWRVGDGDRVRADGPRGAAAGDVMLLPTPVADNSRGLPSSGTDYASLPNAVAALLPTPMTTDGGSNSPGDQARKSPGLRALPALLPTPRATDGTKGGPNQRGSSGDLMLPSAVQLLPTPTVSTAKAARQSTSTGFANDTLDDIRVKESWGDYAPAIARWEAVLGRPAPAPTEPGSKGTPRLSPSFVEWMMGLPAGHVTDVPGLTRNAQLKALGNGVVPQQAAAATRWWLAQVAAQEVAS